MKKTSFDYQKTLNNYIEFLKLLKIYKKKNEIFYENNIEKLNNWKNANFKNNKLILSGTFEIILSDFSINRPSFMMKKMDDLIKISYELHFTKL